MKVIRILIAGIILLSGYYPQDPNHSVRNSNYINNHKEKELALLNKQLKELSEQFSKKEEGINRKIILKGKHIQYVPDIIEQKPKYYYFNPDNYIFIHDMDMNLVLDNLHSSTDNPTIYIIGNKIYKQQEKSKNIYYKKVLKILCNKKLNSNKTTDWTLYPHNIENWQLKIDNKKKLRRPYLSIEVDDEEIYNISYTFALENAIYTDVDSMYYKDNYAKKKVDHFIDQNFDHFINKINEYSKTFFTTEQGIKELHIIAKYNQIIPFEEFDNNYIKIYASLYNIYLATPILQFIS